MVNICIPLSDEHYQVYLDLVKVHRVTVLHIELAVMNSQVENALDCSLITPQSAYNWRRNRVFEIYGPVPIAYKYMEEFCNLYDWDYQLMEDKWEDLRTDPLE
jgi:hypothetical protein